MKQSILKKTSHFFSDAESSITSVNTGSNFNLARSDSDNNHVKNVRFVGVDMVHQLPGGGGADSARTETSFDYINFQRMTGTSPSASGAAAEAANMNANNSGLQCPSPRPRKPKPSLNLKTWNGIFGSERFDDEDQQGTYASSSPSISSANQRPTVVYASNNFLNVSFQLKTQSPGGGQAQQQLQQQQQQQASQQLHHVQHELLRKTLRISSASLESRSNRNGGFIFDFL